MTGYSDVLVGIQYGDEGKAKIVDLIAPQYDIIARFNGGMNAGHTLISEKGKLALRQIPSGVMHEHCMLYIGSGCSVSLFALTQEIQAIRDYGADVKGRLFISGKAAVVQLHHILLDAKYGGMIGTTKNGIGPCYAERAIRAHNENILPVRLQDFKADFSGTVSRIRKNTLDALSREKAREKASENASEKSKENIDYDLTEIEAQITQLSEAYQAIAEYVVEDELFLYNQAASGKRILFEGAQSIHLDVMHGNIPFVTASHTVPSYAYVGGDLPIKFHRKTIGIAKAIESRVGNGPFPGELGGQKSEHYCAQAMIDGCDKAQELANYDADALLQSDDAFDVGMGIRMKTDEYGSGTGRPRRIGMLDLDCLKRSIQCFGIDLLFLNKCDVLNIFGQTSFKKIPIMLPRDEANAEQVVKHFEPFDLPETAYEHLNMLPKQLAEILGFIETELDVKLLGVGLGPSRDKNVLDLDQL